MELDYEVRIKEFNELVLPLMKWLDKNYHPHAVIVVSSLNAELFSGEIVVSNPDYSEDGC